MKQLPDLELALQSLYDVSATYGGMSASLQSGLFSPADFKAQFDKIETAKQAVRTAVLRPEETWEKAAIEIHEHVTAAITAVYGKRYEVRVAAYEQCRRDVQAIIARHVTVPTAAFEAIAIAMETVTDTDWEKIEAATRARLIATVFSENDSPSNRVAARSIITNALFDIRDAGRAKP